MLTRDPLSATMPQASLLRMHGAPPEEHDAT